MLVSPKRNFALSENSHNVLTPRIMAAASVHGFENDESGQAVLAAMFLPRKSTYRPNLDVLLLPFDVRVCLLYITLKVINGQQRMVVVDFIAPRRVLRSRV